MMSTVCLSRICQGDVSDVYSMFIKVTSVMSTVCLSMICQGDVSDVYSMFIKDLSR